MQNNSNPIRVVVCSKNTKSPIMFQNTVLIPKRVCDTVDGDVLLILEGEYPKIKLRLPKEGDLFLGLYQGNWLNLTTSEAGNTTENLKVKNYFFIHDEAILKIAYKNTYGKELETENTYIEGHSHLTMDNCPPPLPNTSDKSNNTVNETFDFFIDEVIEKVNTSNGKVTNVKINLEAKRAIRLWLHQFLLVCDIEHTTNIRKAIDSLSFDLTEYEQVYNIIVAINKRMLHCNDVRKFIKSGSYSCDGNALSYNIEGFSYKSPIEYTSNSILNYSESTFKAMMKIIDSLKSSLIGDFNNFIR